MDPARERLDDADHAGERVLVDVRPHPRVLAGPFALVPLVAGVTSYAVTALPDGPLRLPGRVAVGVLAAVVLARYALWPWLRWRATRYVLTERRLLVRRGVLVRRSHGLPLVAVHAVATREGLLDRMVGSGTLLVDAGGEGGPLMLRAVPQVDALARRLAAAHAHPPPHPRG